MSEINIKIEPLISKQPIEIGVTVPGTQGIQGIQGEKGSGIIPSGEYSTLALLQAAYPTGNPNIYIVAADGNWYYWSGIAWVIGGAFIATQTVNNIQADLTSFKIDYTTERAVDKLEVTTLKEDYANQIKYTNEIFSSNSLIEMFDKTKITMDKAFSGTTGNFIDTSLYFVTDYMWLPKGSNLLCEFDGFSIFGHPKPEAPRKLAVFNANYQHIKTVAFSTLAEYIATENCFIRIAFNKADTRISIKNTHTKKIDPKTIKYSSEYFSGINSYVSSEKIELYNKQDSRFDGAYLDETGEWGDFDNQFEVTKKIFVPANSEISIIVNGVDWKETSGNMKFIVFGANGEWESTTKFSNLINLPSLVFDEPKYIRVQVSTIYTINSIKVEGVNKIDHRKITSNINGSINNKDDGYDVFLFMGQSNMAGRGDNLSVAPNVSDIAYEFKAISDPNQLSPLVEPFGVIENTVDGINDGAMKTGSMVSSFAKKYYEVTGKKLIGISASKGGSSVQEWLQGTPKFIDVVNRLNTFKAFAQNNNITIKNYYMVWNQGEGDSQMTQVEYEPYFNNVVEGLIAEGIDKCFLVRIGHIDGNLTQHASMIRTQTNIAKANPDIILIGNKFAELSKNGYLKDYVHFTQLGYNIQGEQAGINAAYYIQNLKEPTMYDSEFSELYFSNKH